MLILVGFLLAAGGYAFGTGLIWAGIAAFSLTVLFQLVNLPVEFDASRRAKNVLASLRLVSAARGPGRPAVLSAAALTYVAATLTSA